MASKRATAIKAQKAREEMADRMAAIEASQKLIMQALNIKVPGDEDEVEEVDPKAKEASKEVDDAKAEASKEVDDAEGKDASKKASTKK